MSQEDYKSVKHVKILHGYSDLASKCPTVNLTDNPAHYSASCFIVITIKNETINEKIEME